MKTKKKHSFLKIIVGIVIYLTCLALVVYSSYEIADNMNKLSNSQIKKIDAAINLKLENINNCITNENVKIVYRNSSQCKLVRIVEEQFQIDKTNYNVILTYLLNHNKPVLHSFSVGIIGEKYSNADEYKVLSEQDLKPVFDILSIFCDDNYLVNEINYEKITNNINLAINNYDYNKISSSVVSYFWNDTKKEGVSSTTYFINDRIEGCYSSIFFDFSMCKNKCGLDFGTTNDLIVEF